MVSEIKKMDWVVEYKLNYKNQTYTVKRVTQVTGEQHIPRLFEPYTYVCGADELGAFNAGAKLIRNLGFRPA